VKPFHIVMREFFHTAQYAMLRPMIDGGTSQADIGRRIEMLMEALGLNQAAFAKRVGMSPPTVANYLAGFRRPEIDKAMQIASKTGATLDWIYLGVRSGLPMHLVEKLPPFAPPAQKQTG
jgi:DNA-binding XRE family transcriptional regulator